MCVVSVKYFPGIGWVGAKNRDRNYKPTVHIRQSFRNGVERLYIWDEETKWTEGLNEYGIAIISASTMVKDDEDERKTKSDDPDFMSPTGKKVRTALLEKTVDAAVRSCIKQETDGNTYIFDKNNCYLLEAAFKSDEDPESPGEFFYELTKISKDKISARTNHGVEIEAGYDADGMGDEDQKASRKSSETRLETAVKNLKKVKEPKEMLDALSDVSSSDPQMNPLRYDKRRGKMMTTGQLLIIPNDLSLAYRPIISEIKFDFNKIDNPDRKTSFEVVSSKKLLSFDSFSKIKK